jgi:hypothetical protein
MGAQVITGIVIEDSGATFLARIHGNAGTAITPATISSIAFNVFSLNAPSTVVLSGTCTVSSTVFDTLQTDAIWTKDSTGYNFKYAMAATAFPTGNVRYRVSFKFTPTSGEVFHALYEVDSINVFGS